jgi:hypothetical protein
MKTSALLKSIGKTFPLNEKEVVELTTVILTCKLLPRINHASKVKRRGDGKEEKPSDRRADEEE